MKRLLLLPAILFQALFIRAQVQDSTNKVPLIHVATVTNTKSDNYKESTTPPVGRYFSISTDLLQSLLLQPNISIELRYKTLAYGINFGIEYPLDNFDVNPLANGQYTWPAFVYHGDALRLYMKWFYNDVKPTRYFSVQALVKYAWYNNVSFQDQINSDPTLYSNYTMNEKTVVLGFDVIHGHEFCVSKLLHVDFFYGIGIHSELRQYSVTASNASGEYGPLPFAQIPYTGNYKATLTLPVPIMGLKFGFNCLHKTPEAN